MITPVIVAVYLAIGLCWVAPRYVTRAVANYIQWYPLSAKERSQIEEWRREQAVISILIAAVWPFYFLGRFLIGWVTRAALPTSYELTQRIAELEEQLGMGKLQ